MPNFIIEATPDSPQHSLVRKDDGIFYCLECSNTWTLDQVHQMTSKPGWRELITRVFGPPSS